MTGGVLPSRSATPSCKNTRVANNFAFNISVLRLGAPACIPHPDGFYRALQKSASALGNALTRHQVDHTTHNCVQRPTQASNPKEEQLKAAAGCGFSHSFTGVRKHSPLICRWRKDDTNSSNPHDDPVGGGRNYLRMYHLCPCAAFSREKRLGQAGASFWSDFAIVALIILISLVAHLIDRLVGGSVYDLRRISRVRHGVLSLCCQLHNPRLR
jgi:hypothetical protein